MSNTPSPNLVSRPETSDSLAVIRAACRPCSVSSAVARPSTAVARPSTASISVSRVSARPSTLVKRPELAVIIPDRSESAFWKAPTISVSESRAAESVLERILLTVPERVFRSVVSTPSAATARSYSSAIASSRATSAPNARVRSILIAPKLDEIFTVLVLASVRRPASTASAR